MTRDLMNTFTIRFAQTDSPPCTFFITFPYDGFPFVVNETKVPTSINMWDLPNWNGGSSTLDLKAIYDGLCCMSSRNKVIPDVSCWEDQRKIIIE